jgi:hypothetical protein
VHYTHFDERWLLENTDQSPPLFCGLSRLGGRRSHSAPRRISWLARVILPAAVAASILGPAGAVAVAATAGSQSNLSTAAAMPCSAKLTSRHPADGTSVRVTVRTWPSARVSITAHFPSGARTKTGRAGRSGTKSVTYIIGRGAPARRDKVTVAVARGSHHGTCSTWFEPRAAARPRAWCTATASVYNAEYDWNNVYVHSNPPRKDATASAAGYSWSYETNGSGYALIYLNGPPAGVRITVKVGPATCYASD